MRSPSPARRVGPRDSLQGLGLGEDGRPIGCEQGSDRRQAAGGHDGDRRQAGSRRDGDKGRQDAGIRREAGSRQALRSRQEHGFGRQGLSGGLNARRGGVTENDAKQAPPGAGWRGRIGRAGQVVAGNRTVSGVSAVVTAANDAGAPLFAAALAFSTMFATVPLLLLFSGVLGWLIEDPVARARLLADLVDRVPPLADVLADSLEGVVRTRGTLSLVGLIGLVWEIGRA